VRKSLPFKRQNKQNGPEDSIVASDAAVAGAVTQTISTAAQKAAKKSLLSKRLGKDPADTAAQPDPIGKTLLLYGASKIATRSLPGAVIVGGALLAKSALERRALRRARRRTLQAAKAMDEVQAKSDTDAEN